MDKNSLLYTSKYLEHISKKSLSINKSLSYIIKRKIQNNGEYSYESIYSSSKFRQSTNFLIPNNIFKQYNNEVIGKIWSHMIINHEKNSSDGGWFGLLFTSLLIKLGIESDIPISYLIRGYNLASNKVNEILMNASNEFLMSITLSDVINVTKVIETTLITRSILFSTLDINILNKFSAAILNGFLSSLSSLKPFIIYKQINGLQIDKIRTLEGKILMDIPVPLEFPDNITGVSGSVIALFDCSLEMLLLPEEGDCVNNNSTNRINIEIQNNNNDNIKSIKSLEYKVIHSWVNIFIKSGINLIACQKRIHPYLQRQLADNGIYCLQRLSIRYIGILQRITGAKILGSMPTNTNCISILSPSSLGYLGNLKKNRIYGKLYMIASYDIDKSNQDNKFDFDEDEDILENYELSLAMNNIEFINGVKSRRNNVATILITAPCTSICEEIQSLCECAVNSLCSLIDNSIVLIGLDNWKKELSYLVYSEFNNNNNNNNINKYLLNSISIYCYALLSCADISNNKYNNEFNFNSFKNEFNQYLINKENNKNNNKNDINIEYLEPLLQCQNYLQLSVEIASCLLEIDGIIVMEAQEIDK
jgi:chaperonin GroEL (HSP60 family)